MNNQLKILKQKQNDIFEIMAKTFGAMAAPVRLRLIHFLSQSPLTVEVLATKIDQSVANTSMHLRKMLNEGLVNVESHGQKRLYSLKLPVLDFWENYQDFIQKLDPSLKINSTGKFSDLNWCEDWAETRKKMKKNEIILLDIRPEDEISNEVENFPQIIHFAQDDLKKNLHKLPKKKILLVFCRGRMCGLSMYAVNFLRENGFKAYRVEESWTRLKKKL